VAGNVPLNESLASQAPDGSESEAVWSDYLERWTRLNSQRAGASILASFLLLVPFWP
jgi:uncharacterized membrane protein